MKRSLLPIVAVAAALVLCACDWQIPEQVVVRATPEVWIPTGAAVFELEFLDEVVEVFTDLVVDLGFEGGEKEGGGYEGKPLTLYAELVIEAPTFPDPPPGGETFDAFFEDFVGSIDLSEVFGPLSGLVRLHQVPGLVWFERAAGDPDPPPAAQVRLSAEWTVGGLPNTEYLLGDAGGFEALGSSQAMANDFDLGFVFNDLPADLVLHYEFGANSADVGRIASLHLRFEVPFAFDTDPDTFLALEDDEGNNLLLMEGDLFGRDPAHPDEELDRLLESIRGSNATILLRLVNSSGLGVRLGMVNAADLSIDKQDPANWVLDVNILPSEIEQEVQVDISAEVVDQLIDGVGGNKQFVPEFLILLPEDFQVNSLWEFGIIEGHLRVEARIDYEYSLEGEA